MSIVDTSKPNGHGKVGGNSSLLPREGDAPTPTLSPAAVVIESASARPPTAEELGRSLTGTERARLSRYKAALRKQAAAAPLAAGRKAKPAKTGNVAAPVATLAATPDATLQPDPATLRATEAATQRATLRAATAATPQATLRSEPDAARNTRPQHSRLRLWFVYAMCALQLSVLTLFVAAVACAAIDLGQSATVLWRMGATFEDKVIFAGVAGVAGVVLLWGLVWMRQLRRQGNHVWAAALGLVYAAVLVINATFNITFTSSNVSDTVANRKQEGMLQTALKVQLEQKLEERGKLKVPRTVTVATLDASTKALALLCPPERMGNDCRSRMDKHTTLLVDFDQSAKAKQLDDEIKKLERDIRVDKAVGSVDALVDGIKQFAGFFGIDVSERFAHGVRTGGLLVFGLLGGVLLACAKALWEGNVSEMLNQLGEGR